MSLMLRCAFHDAGDYSKEDNTGGCDGNLRLKTELYLVEHTGLDVAIGKLEEIFEEYKLAKLGKISFADLI